MKLIDNSGAKGKVTCWCSVCNQMFTAATPESCKCSKNHNKEHAKVPIHVEPDPAVEEMLTPDQFSAGD